MGLAPLAVVSACAGGSPGPGVPAGPGALEEREPNDGPARAAALAVGKSAHGRVTAGDADWWRLDLRAGDVVTLQLLGMRLDQAGWSANAPTLRVVGPDGATTLVVQDPLGEPSLGWGALDPDLPALRVESTGPHYVCVAADDGARAGGEYVLAVDALGDVLQLEDEPAALSGVNDSAATAEPLRERVVHAFHTAGEEDWYRLEVDEPALLRFVVLGHRNGLWGVDGEGFDPELALFDADLELLATNDDALFDDSLLTWGCASPGTLYLRVGTCCPGGDAPYFLIHEARPLADARAEVEPNDQPWSAPYVEFGRLHVGHVGPGDADTFALPCFAGDRVELWVHDAGRNEEAAAPVELTLRDGTGRPMAMDRGKRLGVRTFRVSADDTWFLRLSAAEETAYAFELRLESATFESEPNDAVPGRLDARGRAAGRIATPGDVDRFELEARAGTPVLLECFADDEYGSRGYDELDGDGSDLDPVLEVRDPDGVLVARASSVARNALGVVHGRSTVAVAFLPRASGAYVLSVRDAAGGSGPTHTYAIQRH